MPSKTPRFGLDRYEIGDTEWTHTDLVNAVDEGLIERDPIANRPTTGEYPDELFLATDEEVLYRWDSGSSRWVVAIHSGLADGEDFDGQDSSSFTNLQSVGTDGIVLEDTAGGT